MTLQYYQTILFNFAVLFFVSCLDILVSKVFHIKPTFCEHLLIVRRWKKPDWNHKNNLRLFWIGFTVWSSSYPSTLLHVVSITNFVASKISWSVFETIISFRFVVPTFESFFGFFFPSLSAINPWTSARTWCKITSRRSRRLIGQFSLSSCSKYGTCENE